MLVLDDLDGARDRLAAAVQAGSSALGVYGRGRPWLPHVTVAPLPGASAPPAEPSLRRSDDVRSVRRGCLSIRPAPGGAQYEYSNRLR